MILVGQYDSPFVRRVAVTLHHYGLPFARKVLSVFADAEAMRAINPLGQVPALVLDDGEVLFGSAFILDHLDEVAGPARALTPPRGARRRAVGRAVAVAAGLAEKLVALRGETVRRAPDRRDPAEAARLAAQVAAALAWLDRQASEGEWLCGSATTQADVTAAAALTYARHKLPDLLAEGAHPALQAVHERAEALPAFRAAPFGEH